MQRYVVVADATRARIYSYEFTYEPEGPSERLHEECDLVDPARQQTSSELFSDRAGSNHSGARGHSVDDHRQEHKDKLDERFAREIIDRLSGLASSKGPRDLIMIASPRMLGELRQHWGELSKTGVAIDELDRDLTKFTTHELRGRLGELGLLPPRLAGPTMAH